MSKSIQALFRKKPAKQRVTRKPRHDRELQEQIEFLEWIRASHREVEFTSDLSGLPLHPKTRASITVGTGQLRRSKKTGKMVEVRRFALQSSSGFADVHILALDNRSHLWMELKETGAKLKNKSGNWATDHIAEQAAFLRHRRLNGDIAVFAVGLAEMYAIFELWYDGASPAQIHEFSPHKIF